MGAEIENIEVLFTDQGLYVFKLYTNGHPYDTSLVWASFFKTLVDSHYIPAIIVPKGFPNSRTFSLLTNYIPQEFSASLITYKDDYFDECESYYDFKPVTNLSIFQSSNNFQDKIKEGDIIINEETVHLLKLPDIHSYYATTVKKPRTLLRASTELAPVVRAPIKTIKPIKDIAGTIMTEVISSLLKDGSFDNMKVCFGLPNHS